MAWQDLVISIASMIFIYALIPQIYISHKNKKKNINFQTAFLTTIGLFTTAIAFLTLKLYFSSITSFISGTCWYVLTIQSIVYR